MKKVLKALAILLSVVFMFQVIQVSLIVYAAPVKATIDRGSKTMIDPSAALERDIDIDGAPESAIEEEVISLREESVKHFRKADGSFLAVTYPEPVHYRENGLWKNVDTSYLFI